MCLYVTFLFTGNTSRANPVSMSTNVGRFVYDERLEGAVIGGMAVTVLLLVALIVLCVVRRCITLPTSKIAAGIFVVVVVISICQWTLIDRYPGVRLQSCN